MSQSTPESSSNWGRTIHGFGYVEDSPPIAPPDEPRFVPVGAPVGRSGQVFETEAETDIGAGASPLVVKLFTWAAGLPGEVVQDFTRAALTVANLRHPHVVQVTDAGTLADGTPFVVMERLAGMTLQEAATNGRVRIAAVWSILRSVASALSAAHAAGVAHGDVRAENIFMAEAAAGWPTAKLLDFGVARLMVAARSNGGATRESATEMVVPAPLELGARAGERADQLAFARLATELIGPGCSPALERVLLRASHPDPRQRFETVTTLVDALEEASVRGAVPASVAPGAIERTRVRAPRAVPPRHAVLIALPEPPPVVRSARRAAVAVVAGAPSARRSPVEAIASPPAAPVANLPVAPAASLGIAAVASPVSSLTQQFFAAGEQLEVAHAASPDHAAAEPETYAASVSADDDDLVFAPEPRVPRSRAQMLSTALLALGSVAVIAWTVARLADKPAASPAAPKASATAPAPGGSTAASPGRGRLLPTAGGRGPRGVATGPSRGRPAPAGRVQPPPFVAPTSIAPALPAAPVPAQAAPSAAPPREQSPAEADVTSPDEQTEGDPALAAPPPANEAPPAPAESREVPPPPSALPAPAAPESAPPFAP